MSYIKFSELTSTTIFTKAADDFLNSYMSPAFGSLSKNEVDLLVLNLLETIGYVDKHSTIYDLVGKLKVTREKSRKLIYERALRKSSSTDLDQMVIEALKNLILAKDGKFFILEIENPLLLDHLRSQVTKLGFISDGSFSPSIVKLQLNAIVALIDHYLPTQNKEAVMTALNQAGAPNGSFKGVLKGMLIKLSSKLADESGEVLASHVGKYMGPILDSAISKIERIWKGV